MRFPLFLFLAAASVASAQSEDTTPITPPDAPTPSLVPAGPPAETNRARRVEHEGEVFELAGSTKSGTVETDEYVAAGEKLGEWTQLVTVQRLALRPSTSAEDFLGYFQKRVAEDGASFESLFRSKSAGVFAVRFAKTDGNDEQVMICLAFPSAAAPTQLTIVQYAIKPTRGPIDLVERRIRSWRDKFVQQARALDAPGVTPRT